MVIFNSFLYVYQRVIRCYSAGATHSEVRTKISGTNLGTWELGGAVGGCDGFTAMETSAGIYPQDPISSIYQYIIYIYISVCIFMYMYSYQFISWMFHKNKLGPWLFHRKKNPVSVPYDDLERPRELVTTLWQSTLTSEILIYVCMIVYV